MSYSDNTKPLYALSIAEFELLVEAIVLKVTRNSSASVATGSDEVLLKIEDVCKLLKVSKVTIFKWIKSRRLPSYKIGSRLFFKRKEVIESLSDNISLSGKNGTKRKSL